jgi:hypothetical protein
MPVVSTARRAKSHPQDRRVICTAQFRWGRRVGRTKDGRGQAQNGLQGKYHRADRLPKEREAGVALGLHPRALGEVDKINGIAWKLQTKAVLYVLENGCWVYLITSEDSTAQSWPLRQESLDPDPEHALTSSTVVTVRVEESDCRPRSTRDKAPHAAHNAQCEEQHRHNRDSDAGEGSECSQHVHGPRVLAPKTRRLSPLLKPCRSLSDTRQTRVCQTRKEAVQLWPRATGAEIAGLAK